MTLNVHVYIYTCLIAEEMSFTGMQAMLAAMDEEFNQCYVFKRKISANNIIAISIDQSLQEMRESHGQRLSGVAKRLRLTGKAGNRKSNIERDMHRHVGLKVCMHLCIYAYLICYSVV